MFILISPAKKLAAITKPFFGATTHPLFTEATNKLVHLMKAKSAADLARLMSLSPDLAALNYDRYQRFNLDEHPVDQSCPALFLFQGDVYQGLQAASWSQEDVDYSQSHLGILSGLYGLLRPLDTIQPYRLEMGVRLANPAGDTLYSFWRTLVTQYLNAQLAKQTNPILINLASTEYFKVVQESALDYPVATINFYEQKNNELKMVGIYAKKARGVMARFIIQHQIDTLDGLRGFNELGYRVNEASSSEHRLDFVRK